PLDRQAPRSPAAAPAAAQYAAECPCPTSPRPASARRRRDPAGGEAPAPWSTAAGASGGTQPGPDASAVGARQGPREHDEGDGARWVATAGRDRAGGGGIAALGLGGGSERKQSMDAQTVSQIHHMMERSQREVAANAQVLGYLTI